MEEITCPVCKGKDRWGPDGYPVFCRMCEGDGVVTLARAVAVLLTEIEELKKGRAA